MFKFLVMSFLVISVAQAKDSVHSIVKGTDGEAHLVKYNSGAVEFVDSSDSKKIELLESEIIMTPELNDTKSLLEVEPAYVPTAVSDSDIPAIFNRMNPYMRRKSECSDRAHVWSWDENQKSGINSEKVFLFLTDTYIRKYRYKWWFHVAPLYTTTSGQKIVMDYQFLDRPVTFTEWKNLLVFSKRECVTDFRFIDYNAGADQSQDCYQKFESMYNRIPADIASRENGRARMTWNIPEVKSARARAFYKESL